MPIASVINTKPRVPVLGSDVGHGTCPKCDTAQDFRHIAYINGVQLYECPDVTCGQIVQLVVIAVPTFGECAGCGAPIFTANSKPYGCNCKH